MSDNRIGTPNEQEYNFVKEIFEDVALATDSGSLGIEPHISRDILVYSYILYINYNENPIQAKRLLQFVGTDKIEELQSALRLGKFERHMENVEKDGADFKSFIFKKGILGAIKSFIYGDDSLYQLESVFSLAPKTQITGEDVIVWLNELSPNSREQGIRFLENLFKTMGFTVDGVDGYPRHRAIHGTNTNGEHKSFVLCVIESFETIDKTVLDEIRDGYDAYLTNYRLPFLVVTSSVGNGLREWINKRGNVYCMWDFTLVRFLQGLGRIYNEERQSKILKSFNKIFKQDKDGNYIGLAGSACYVEGEALMPFIEMFKLDFNEIMGIKKNT